MIKPVARINVVPALPESLRRLQELAYNMRWAWDHDTIALFRRLDRDLWEATGRNPVWMLGLVSQERLNAVCEDPAFMAHLHTVCDSFDAYMSDSHTWYNTHYGQEEPPTIAYFSMEFGITECLQNYSGGLGVLSGDHLKSASDLGLPLVGVGLLYQEGYFHQYLNADGYQQESYPINDYSNLPVTLQRNKDGTPITISVPMPGRELYAYIWKVQVGRIPLFLLDSNTPMNTREEDRNLTDRLYGGDRRTRIRQEILMGIGGIRALESLGLRPSICHMNEGHSAFLGLERTYQIMQEHKLAFDQAREIAASSHIFTTHTPVPAGLERFGFDLMDEHFTNYYKMLGLTREQFLDLGRENMGDYQLFSMPVLALNLSAGANGVAKLHGVVSRHLWHWMYPNVPENEIPVDSITNGIHTQTWISREMGTLLDRYLDPAWRTEDSRADIWEAMEQVPDSELWRTHERRRERLVAFTRRRLRTQLENRGAPQHEVESADEVLNPDVLTIGFARRFATYKRATLLFRDLERLKKIVSNADRPVQIIFAGKAHPHDTGGKELIKQIVNIARTEDFRHAIVFLENYDMSIARMLVQGVDVWLNTPQRPKEASGTSGMKVIYNGGLNCSILDGWWAEGYNPEYGWAIGNGEEYPEQEWERQNYIESEALYNILEKDIIPLFYERGRDSLPREWIGRMKKSMQVLAPYFNTHRMVAEYTEKFYMPSFHRVKEITENNLTEGVAFATWRNQLEKVWSHIKIKHVEVSRGQVKVGSEVEVNAQIDLGQLTPDDVRVQIYYEPVDTRGEIGRNGMAVDMTPVNGNGSVYTFNARVQYDTSGERGLSVRVLPYNKYLHTSFLPSLITWA
ncbi:MAG: alpha-glucan family phosphorylase [Anaerolineaceae bacterium]|nr:alpha-glucan family phosphorylase [Anaerolineaceae bacterium]